MYAPNSRPEILNQVDGPPEPTLAAAQSPSSNALRLKPDPIGHTLKHDDNSPSPERKLDAPDVRGVHHDVQSRSIADDGHMAGRTTMARGAAIAPYRAGWSVRGDSPQPTIEGAIIRQHPKSSPSRGRAARVRGPRRRAMAAAAP